MSKSRAHVEHDFLRQHVRIALRREEGSQRMRARWSAEMVADVDDYDAAQPNDDAWLTLRTDDARALYEALADHFGHTGNDVRALRRDYDAERKRVDLLIGLATREPQVVKIVDGPRA